LVVISSLHPTSQPISRGAGITIVELLIVIAVVATLVGLVALNGRRVLQSQEQGAAIASLQQTVWQGATAAAARGVVTRLTRDGNTFRLVDTDSGRVLRTFELPRGVTTNWPNGQALDFTPPGKVDPATLTQLPDPLTMTTYSQTTVLTVSLIGEVKAQAQ
jgi:Tfp pilus assembly protein FimT